MHINYYKFVRYIINSLYFYVKNLNNKNKKLFVLLVINKDYKSYIKKIKQ